MIPCIVHQEAVGGQRNPWAWRGSALFKRNDGARPSPTSLVEYLANAMGRVGPAPSYGPTRTIVAKADIGDGWPQTTWPKQVQALPLAQPGHVAVTACRRWGASTGSTQEVAEAVGVIQNPPADVDWGRIGALTNWLARRVKLGMGKALDAAQSKKSGP